MIYFNYYYHIYLISYIWLNLKYYMKLAMFSNLSVGQNKKNKVPIQILFTISLFSCLFYQPTQCQKICQDCWDGVNNFICYGRYC